MKHSEFKSKWLWKWYKENSTLWTQCVAWVKLYCKEVFWIDLGSFWWTAYNWYITWKPFIWYKFKRFKNTPDFLPKVWDIVFFDKDKSNWNCGHVGIVDFADLKTMRVLNQNFWNWDWKWADDFFKISNFDYITPKCLGFYRLIG